MDKNTWIQLRVSKKEKGWMKQEAKKEGRCLSNYVRHVCRVYSDRVKGKQ